MAGTNGDAPDEIESLLNDVSGSEGSNTDATASGDTDSGQLEALQGKAGTHGASQQQKPVEPDWKTRFTELKKRYDPVAQKKNELEGLLRNPELQKLASQHPQLRDALAKAGFTYADDVVEADEAEGVRSDQFDPENNAMHRIAALEASYNFDRQESAFERKLGREMKEDEKRAVYEKISKIRGLSIEEAYMLTPFFAKAQKEAEERRVQEAIKKLPPGRRPAPRDPFTSGQKLDMKRDVREMKNPDEIAAKLQEIMDSSGH